MSPRISALARWAGRPWPRVVLGSLVAAVLLALVLHKVSLATVGHALTHVSPPLVLLAALLAAGYVAMRALRYRLLLGGGSSPAVLGVTAASWGAGQVLPGPGGDAAFIWLARRELGASVPRGTGAAVVARLFDFASLAVILLVAADLAGARLPRSLRMGAITLALVLLVVIATLFIERVRQPLLRRVEGVRFVGRLAVRAETALGELSSWRVGVGLLATTAGARVLAALEYLCLFLALGAHVTFWQVWLALAVRTLLFALPIQGVGGFGTSQVWWGAGLALAGLAIGPALTLGLEIQVMDLLVALPEGLIGWLGLRARRLIGHPSVSRDPADGPPASSELVGAGSRTAMDH